MSILQKLQRPLVTCWFFSCWLICWPCCSLLPFQPFFFLFPNLGQNLTTCCLFSSWLSLSSDRVFPKWIFFFLTNPVLFKETKRRIMWWFPPSERLWLCWRASNPKLYLILTHKLNWREEYRVQAHQSAEDTIRGLLAGIFLSPWCTDKTQFIKIIKKDLGPSCERHVIFHERSAQKASCLLYIPFINQTPLALRLHADMSARFGSAALSSTWRAD